MSWTNERIELLQKLWLEGWSASRIAAELSHGVTRNAVIGKVYRLGLSGRAKAAAAAVPASPSRHRPDKSDRRPGNRQASSPPIAGNTALAMLPFAVEAPAPQRVREVVVPISEPVTILELRESMCRWPIGDPAQPEFRYCGAKKRPGLGPYCACHSSIAFQSPHERRRERRQQG
ncbi:MAG: GcrA cell cycle regulator [Beijerinckiaceae bacterium]|nr:GcrA cell cycle regulator [Beijerinckiaceae bacterium]